jgi:hypothetical protein
VRIIQKKPDQKKIIIEKINNLQQLCKNYIDIASRIEFDLTAGKDTRFILSILQDIIDKEIIITRTLGERYSIDNIIAKKISDFLDIKHKIIDIGHIEKNEFRENLSFFSFFFNGDTNGLRALDKVQFDDYNNIRFGGVRNTPERFYWNGILNKGKKLTIPNVISYMNSYNFNKDKSIEMKNQINGTIKEVMEDIYSLTENEDLQTKFIHLFTKFSNLGSLVYQRNWQLQNIEPMNSIDFTKLILQLPLSSSENYLFYEIGIKTNSPALYKLPINGNPFYRLSLNKYRMLRPYLKFMQKVYRRNARFFKRKDTLIFEDSVGFAFRNEYQSTIREILLSSILTQEGYFPFDKMNEIVNMHIDGVNNYQNTIGILLIIESFLRYLKEVADYD